MSDISIFLQSKGLKKSKTGIWFRQGTKLSDGEIAQIVEMFIVGISQTDIARITKRDYKTIQKYHNRFVSADLENLFFKKHKDALSGTFTSTEKLEFFKEMTKSCPGMTLKGMKLTYFLNFGDSISCSMIHYILTEHLNKSFKKIVPIEWARTKARVIMLHDRFFVHFKILFPNLLTMLCLKQLCQ